MSEYLDFVAYEMNPTRNAVIIELLESGKRVVSIECKDGAKLEALKDCAHSLIRQSPKRMEAEKC